MSWTDAAKTLRTWRRQRFAHSLFVPVAVTLVVASLVGAPWPLAPDLLVRGAAAWIAVLSLRLWDDLEDRQRDAGRQPERVLTQVPAIRPYAFTVAGLALVAGLLMSFSGGTALGWLVVLAFLMAFYRLAAQRRTSGTFVLLLKYPLIIIALGGSLEPIGLAAMSLVLAGVCTDEILQRPSPRRWQVMVGTASLAGSAALLLFQTRQAPIRLLALQSALIAGMSALGLQSLLGKPRQKMTRAGLLAMTLLTLLLCNSPHIAEFIHGLG